MTCDAWSGTNRSTLHRSNSCLQLRLPVAAQPEAVDQPPPATAGLVVDLQVKAVPLAGAVGQADHRPAEVELGGLVDLVGQVELVGQVS